MNSFGMGTLHFGSLLEREESREIIHEAIDNGVTFFDTAPLYGKGRAEEILGDVLSTVSQPVFVCTKAGLKIAQRKDQRFGVEIIRLNAMNLKMSVEASLKRLKRDTIDLLMLHAFDLHTPLDETIEALNQLHQEGKIQGFGCSNYNPSQLQLLLQNTRKSLPFVAAQCHYNMIERRAGRIFVPLCEKNQVKVVVNRALARGALSGQYRADQPLPEGSRASRSVRIQKWLTSKRLALLEQLALLAENSNTSLANISLQWLLKKHTGMIVLLGAKNKRQLRECLQAARKPVRDAIFEEVEQLINKEENVYQSPPRYFEK